jgi:uncharacterized protein (TIGR03435 family)
MLTKRFPPGPRHKDYIRVSAFVTILAGALSFTVTRPTAAQAQPNLPQAQAPQNSAAAPPAPKYEFEVISIKPTQTRGTSFVSGFTADGYRANHDTIMRIIVQAFGVPVYSITGVPPWLSEGFYDVEAKMDEATAEAMKAMSPDQRKDAQQQMLQAMLADRLALKTHSETMDGSVYFLTTVNRGAKLQAADLGKAVQLAGPDGGNVSGVIAVGRGSEGGRRFNATSVNMAYFVRVLTNELRKPVIDNTGLAGAYDFTLEFAPEHAPPAVSNDPGAPPSEPGAASIFTAIQQQLGLKLEAGRGPVQIFVIDHIERPSGN